jgi:hypothetical protein
VPLPLLLLPAGPDRPSGIEADAMAAAVAEAEVGFGPEGDVEDCLLLPAPPLGCCELLPVLLRRLLQRDDTVGQH